jgi:hypothetical protein
MEGTLGWCDWGGSEKRGGAGMMHRGKREEVGQDMK